MQSAQTFADLGRVDVGGQHEHRRATPPGFLQSRDSEACTRAGGRNDHAEPATGAGVAVGHVGRRGFVTTDNMTDRPFVTQDLVQADVVHAGNTEDRGDPSFFQRLNNSLCYGWHAKLLVLIE